MTSAASLSKEQEELLKKKLETMSGKTVVMELKTDPSVLAGVRVELDGKLFDGTVKGRFGRAFQKNQQYSGVGGKHATETRRNIQSHP